MENIIKIKSIIKKIKHSNFYNLEFILYVRRLIYNLLSEYLNPEGNKGIDKLGYKKYVGFNYEFYGKSIYNGIIQNLNLKKSDIFFDIGCGSLRYGKFIISYLDSNCYIGFDKEKKLIDLACKNELDNKLLKKNPLFIVNNKFDFSLIKTKPNFIFSNSLFTHLNSKDIDLLLKKIKLIAHEDFNYYTSLNLSKYSFIYFGKSRANRNFSYSKKQIEKIAKRNNLYIEYMGNNWGHPGKLELIKITQKKTKDFF